MCCLTGVREGKQDDQKTGSVGGVTKLRELALHSHSIILSHGNALTWQRKFSLSTLKNRLSDPSEICALDFRRECRRSKNSSVSTTIDIDRSSFGNLGQPRSHQPGRKNTVSLEGRNNRPRATQYLVGLEVFALPEQQAARL
jgi:hypothetical protein